MRDARNVCSFFHYKYTLSAHKFGEDDARAHSMTTSPPFSMLAFFASSSIAFLAARRSFRSAFRLALPVRAAPLTRFFAASCLALAPRFTLSA